MTELKDDLDLEDKPSESEIRIKELSNKVKLTAKERDEFAELNKKLTQERDSLSKEKDFYSSFSDAASSYPNAKDHKEEIKAKVLAGYTVEDATISVLAKVGKLQSGNFKSKTDAAGGSADVSIKEGSKKTPQEMTQAERKEALMQAEKEGNISWT